MTHTVEEATNKLDGKCIMSKELFISSRKKIVLLRKHIVIWCFQGINRPPPTSSSSTALETPPPTPGTLVPATLVTKYFLRDKLMVQGGGQK